MRPNRSTAARTAASASARLVTSNSTASRSLDWPNAADTRSVFRAEATTACPAANAARQKSTPMPRLAPVINQIFLVLMFSLLPSLALLSQQRHVRLDRFLDQNLHLFERAAHGHAAREIRHVRTKCAVTFVHHDTKFHMAQMLAQPAAPA